MGNKLNGTGLATHPGDVTASGDTLINVDQGLGQRSRTIRKQRKDKHSDLKIPTEPAVIHVPEGVNQHARDYFFIQSVLMHPACPEKLKEVAGPLAKNAKRAWSFGQEPLPEHSRFESPMIEEHVQKITNEILDEPSGDHKVELVASALTRFVDYLAEQTIMPKQQRIIGWYQMILTIAKVEGQDN